MVLSLSFDNIHERKKQIHLTKKKTWRKKEIMLDCRKLEEKLQNWVT